MALGYTTATILKRRSHVYSDDKVIVKVNWLEQLNRNYVQAQGKERSYVIFVAQQLGLDGSYVPRTYIKKIQLEKLVNDVMALPDDLKTKLSIDDRRVKYLNRNILRSFVTNRERNLSKLARLAVDDRSYNGIVPRLPPGITNQGAISQLSEQISMLNDRMDEFTSRIQELNSKISVGRPASRQNLVLQSEGCNGSAPPLLMAVLSNGFR